MKNKKHLIWIVPLSLIIIGSLLFWLVFLLPQSSVRALLLIGLFILVTSLIVFFVAAGAVYLVFKLIRKALKKEEPVRSETKTALIVTCCVLYEFTFIATAMITPILLFGGDPFYEIFIRDPYKIETEYDEEWMIGKTLDEITEKYGQPNHGHPKIEYSPVVGYAIKYERKQHNSDSWGYETIFIVMEFDLGEDGRLNGTDICTGTHRE